MLRHECYPKLAAMFNSQDSAILVTVEADGRMRTSEITQPFLDGAGNLWFFAGSRAPLVCHIEANPDVCVFSGDAAQPKAISLSGIGFVINNVLIMRKLSAQMPRMARDMRLDTGEMVLVRVTVDYAEYRDVAVDKPLRLSRAAGDRTTHLHAPAASNGAAAM